MSNLTTALLCALVYYGVFVLDEAFSWQALTRPIVYGPIVGLVLGDLYTGCVMGAYLEAIYMGIISAGGGSPADNKSAAVICTAFVIAGGLSTDAAVALAIPIGTIMAALTKLIVPIHTAGVALFERYAAEGNSKAFCRLQNVYRFIVPQTIQTLVVFFAVWFGAGAVSSAFNALPQFIITGLGVAGNLMPALGLGILLSMTFEKRYLPWLVIGFALSAYAGLSTIAIAVLAGSAAILVFYQDSEKKDAAKDQPVLDAASTQTGTTTDDEEGFFA